LLATDARKWFKYFAGILFFAAIFVSFSRSFEVGLAAALMILFIFKIRSDAKNGFKWLLRAMLLAVLGYLVVGLISGAVFGATVSRFSISDSAASTRMAELSPLWSQIKKAPVFGSGFGITLTFKSEDPRVTTTNPTGMYTTSAFEWGYLDILMKIGIVGLGIYLYLIWKIGAGLWKKRADNYNFGLFLGLVALLAINIFSPYLNHPLGIGYLMILTALI
jgi:O-antigen ligase